MAGDETRGEHEGPQQIDGRPGAANDGDEVVVHDVGEPGEASGETVTPTGRRLGLAAMAVFAVAVVGVAIVAFRNDDKPTAMADGSGSPGEYLVAGWMPESWEPKYAALNPGIDDGLTIEGEDSLTIEGEIAVYGDASLDDPWTGPVLSAARYKVDPASSWTDDEAEEITIGDVPGLLRDDGEIVTVQPTEPIDGENVIVVTGYGLEPDAVTEAAEHLTPDPAVGPEALPDGHEEIARGPASAMTASMGTAGLGIAYGPPGQEEPSLGLAQQQAAGPEAAGLIRLLALDPELGNEDEVTEVRGQPAYILRNRGGHAEAGASAGVGSDSQVDESEVREFEIEVEVVQWFEPSLGLVVTASFYNLDEATVDELIENLRVADQDELDELLDQDGTPPGPDGDDEDITTDVERSGSIEEQDIVREGVDTASRREPVVAAEGEQAGAPWELMARDVSDNMGSSGDEGYVELELLHRSAGGSMSVPDTMQNWHLATAGPIGTGDEQVVGVFGFTDAKAAEAILELPGGESYPLDVYEIAGWDVQAVLGFVPFDDTGAQVVALDAAGDPLPGWPVDVELDRDW